MPEYSTNRRRRGGRMGADPFWDLQYPNGQNGGLESALRGTRQEYVDVGVFQEIKLTEGIYTRFSARYKVVATLAPRQHQGSVAIFYQDSPVFAVEVIHQIGTNVIACQMETGEKHWYIVGCYLTPGDGTTIRYV